MQYTETQLTKLIEDVEKEFTAHLAKAEEAAGAPLAKSEDGEKKPKEDKEKEKPAPEAKPEAEAKPEMEAKPQAEAKPAMEAKPEGAAPAPAAAAPEHDYDDEDLKHLHQMYSSMSDGERKVHHDAIMKCASMAKCGDVESGAAEAPHGAEGQQAPASHSHPAVQKSELNAHGEKENPPQPKVKGKNLDSDPANGGIEGQEPNNSPGAKSPASDANGAKINKAEHDRRNGGKIEEQMPNNSPGSKSPASKVQGSASDMEKSENAELELLKAELSAKDAKYEELKKTFDGVAAFLTKLVEKKAAPAAKAITSLDVIAKSENEGEKEPLKKEEIHSKLLAKSQDPTTSKADRDAINAFYLGSELDVKRISHLLK
jgi:hypothetical protein